MGLHGVGLARSGLTKHKDRPEPPSHGTLDQGSPCGVEDLQWGFGFGVHSASSARLQAGSACAAAHCSIHLLIRGVMPEDGVKLDASRCGSGFGVVKMSCPKGMCLEGRPFDEHPLHVGVHHAVV